MPRDDSQLSIDNGFREYRKLILSELKRMDDHIQSLESAVSRMHTELAILNLKAGIWGAVAGTVVVIGMILVQIFFQRK